MGPISSNKALTKMLCRGFLPLLILATTLITGDPASGIDGTVTFDFEGMVFVHPDTTIKDHSLIFTDGMFHIFYIMGDQTSFGHATSPDLRRWTILEPVLKAGPEEWDCNRIWAPYIVPYPEFPFYLLMYYTGVNSSLAQRTCLALTRTMGQWTKSSTAAFVPFHGDTSWIQWNDQEWSNYRDPSFFEEDGVCYLVHTAHTRDGYGAIALAESEDYFNWHDSGPVYIHNNWHSLESAVLLKREGRYHLFFTEELVGGISHMSSDSMKSDWNILTRSIIDGGHACELLDTGLDSSVFSRHSSYACPAGMILSSIKFDTMTWSQDQPVVQAADPFGGEWNILWGTAFDNQPVFRDNPRYRGDDTTQVGYEGNWWIGTYESFNGPISGTSPGSIQGDALRGALKSRVFTVRGYSMRLLVGGGNYPDSCYIALCRARNGEILLKETGSNSDLMTERIWDLSPFRGMRVYLQIVDDCSGALGHINVDGIEERPERINPPPAIDESDTAPRSSKKRILFQSLTDSEIRLMNPPGTHRFYNHPNPFNPHTEISFEGEPDRLMTVVIYTVLGQQIRRLETRTDSAGNGVIVWDGRDSRGSIVVGGAYIAALRDGVSVLGIRKLILVR